MGDDDQRGPKHKVRLPTFVSDEDVGLGDVVKRATPGAWASSPAAAAVAAPPRSTVGWCSADEASRP